MLKGCLLIIFYNKLDFDITWRHFWSDPSESGKIEGLCAVHRTLLSVQLELVGSKRQQFKEWK